jgi:hypothetical protein
VDPYGTPTEKIALVAGATRVAKQEMVTEEGIGEDLPFSLMVWREALLTAVCQLEATMRDEEPGERLTRTLQAAAACRQGFDATSFTFVTEGFCATDPDAIDPDVPLAAQFVTNHEVRECLTITHIEAGNIYLSALPYHYEIGRQVKWDKPLHYDPIFPTSNQFLTSMTEILLRDLHNQTPNDKWRDATAEEVSRWGFHIQYDLEADQ